MTRTHHTSAAALIILVLAAAGCSGGAENGTAPVPTGPTTASTGPDTSATSTASVTASGATDAAGPSQAPGPSPIRSSTPADPDPTRAAAAVILRGDDVPPAPPGTKVVADPGPVTTRTPDTPSSQVASCARREAGERAGPPEPGAVAAAVGSLVTGVAQLDQYVVVYRDEQAALVALGRHRALAQDCVPALQLRGIDPADATVRVGTAPQGVQGFTVNLVIRHPGTTSDEASAVLRSGRGLMFLRTNETGVPEGLGWVADGRLDQAWVATVWAVAARQLGTMSTG